MAILMRIAAAITLSGAIFMPVSAAERSDIARDAERFSQCVQALDADCLVTVLYVEGYEALSPPGFEVWATQKRFYEALRRNAGGYREFRVLEPVPTVSSGGKEFALVRYTSASHMAKDLPEAKVNGLLIGVPEEGGHSWRFLDTGNLTREQVQKALPALDIALVPLR